MISLQDLTLGPCENKCDLGRSGIFFRRCRTCFHSAWNVNVLVALDRRKVDVDWIVR
jgi:hypothetical protein